MISLDVRDYRQHLLTVKQRKASTINRHLTSISAWLNWTLSTGQIEDNPNQQVNSIREVHLSPKWQSRPEESALMHQVERDLRAARTEAAKQ